ncbi:hypothetical protein ACS0TY_003479 [Phlomoides rotata]
MILTQRSEGAHAYFDDFVHSRSTLKQFMEQYDMDMDNKIQKEFIADFQSKNKVVKCVSTFCWEKQFQREIRIQRNIVLSHYAGLGPKEHQNRQRERSWNSLRKDALVNWVPTISDNVPPSQTTENTQVGGGTPILNPIVTTTRGRPRSNRYISRVEERSRGHVRRNYTEDDDIEGSGEGQGRGHRRRACGRGVGRGRGQGRVGGRGNNGHGDGMVTQGNEGA